MGNTASDSWNVQAAESTISVLQSFAFFHHDTISEETFERAANAARMGGPPFLLHELGSTGKSQICIKFSERSADRWVWIRILTINISTWIILVLLGLPRFWISFINAIGADIPTPLKSAFKTFLCRDRDLLELVEAQIGGLLKLVEARMGEFLSRPYLYWICTSLILSTANAAEKHYWQTVKAQISDELLNHLDLCRLYTSLTLALSTASTTERAWWQSLQARISELLDHLGLFEYVVNSVHCQSHRNISAASSQYCR